MADKNFLSPSHTRRGTQYARRARISPPSPLSPYYNPIINGFTSSTSLGATPPSSASYSTPQSQRRSILEEIRTNLANATWRVTSDASSDEAILNSSPLYIPPKTPPRSPRSDSSDSETKDFSSPRSSHSEPPVADYEDREEASSSNPITAGFVSLKNSLLTGPIAMSARNWFEDLTAFILGAEYKPKPVQVSEDDIVETPIGNYVKLGADWVPLSKTWDKPWENKIKRVGYVENGEGKSYEILVPTKKDIDFIELDSFRLPVNQMHRQYKHIPYSNYGGKINVRDEGKSSYLKRIKNAAIRKQGGTLEKLRKASRKIKKGKNMDFDFD